MFDTGEAEPVELERADFNGDGLQDVAVITSAGGGKVHFLTADGAGRLLKDLTLIVPYATGIGSGDFNRDGIRDVVVTQGANKLAADIYCGAVPGAILFLGTGGGGPAFQFARCLAGFGAGHHLTDAVTGDFNGDGNLDVAVADDAFYSLRVYRGAGDGTFLAPIRATDASGIRVLSPLTSLDVNHDGFLDIIAATGGGIATFFGNGAGGLRFTSTAVGGAGLYQHMGILSFGIGDLNHDGHADIVGVERGSLPPTPTTPQSWVFAALGSGDGVAYTTTATLAFPSDTAGAVAIVDFDKDAAADVAIADRAGNAVRLLAGNGDGTFTEQAPEPVGVEPLLLAAADWNGDNWPDLAVVDRNLGSQSRTWVLTQVPGVGDDISPTASVTAPASAAVLQGTVTVSAAASDASGVARVDFYAGANLIGSDTTDPFSITWDTTLTPNGAQVLSAIAVDTFDNMGTSAGVPVTLDNPDTTAPIVTLTSPAAAATLSGVAVLTAAATDFNGVTRVEFSSNGVLLGSDTTPPFTYPWTTPGVPPGTYALTARAFDAAGNAATSAPVSVTVNQPPTADAGLPQTVEATSPAGASVTVTGTGADTDQGDTLSFAWRAEGQALGTTATLTLTLAPGIHALVLRVTDALGAFADDVVEIAIDDTTPPTLTLPGNLMREATGATGANVTYTATASDIVGGNLPVTCAPASGSSFALGATPVNCSAQDLFGNSASGSFTITVVDTTPPAVVVPAAVSVPATSPAGAVVTFTASASDLVSGTVPVSCTPASGGTFAIGSTRVTCTADDAAGLRGTASFNVTVADQGAPVLTVPSDVTVEAAGSLGASVTYTATATDAIDGTVAVTCAPASGSTFALGATTVACSATDTQGNTGSAGFSVTVVDTTAPAVTVPASVTLYGATATGLTHSFNTTASDAVDGALIPGCTPASGSLFPVGSTLVTCTAIDAHKNAGSAGFTVTVAPPITSVSLTADRAAPQQPGTTVTFTAQASGGVGPLEFKWWVYDGVNWTIAQSWSTTTTFAWTPAAANGNYLVYVWTRSAGNTVDTSERMVGTPYAILASSITGVTIAADRPSPQAPGTSITFTAAATGGIAPYQFKWWVYDGVNWTIAQTWSTASTFTWTPASASADYLVYVWARSAGNTADTSERMTGMAYAILASSITGVTIAADRAAPQAPGTSITFTAAATGGIAPYQFKWWVYDGVNWTIAQSWSTTTTFTWTPTSAYANYLVYVWARSAGNTADSPERMTGTSYAILASSITSVTIAADLASPQAPGTSITFTAAATGGIAPYQFKWWVYDGVGWTVAQNWSTASTFTWTPASASANYLVYVWARSAGNTADSPERMIGTTYAIGALPSAAAALSPFVMPSAPPAAAGTSAIATPDLGIPTSPLLP
jgi:hypothetical protein